MSLLCLSPAVPPIGAQGLIRHSPFLLTQVPAAVGGGVSGDQSFTFMSAKDAWLTCEGQILPAPDSRLDHGRGRGGFI